MSPLACDSVDPGKQKFRHYCDILEEIQKFILFYTSFKHMGFQ